MTMLLTISKLYCKFCSTYFVTQAALERQKTAKFCKSMRIDCYINSDEVIEVPEAEVPEAVVPELRQKIFPQLTLGK